jgi:hypothetical protein
MRAGRTSQCAERQGHFDAVCSVLAKSLGRMAIA